MAVTAEVKNRVGWITLDRPPGNAGDVRIAAEGRYRIGLPELMTTGRTVTFASEDAREGMTASNEKRAPRFTGS